ncbi:hypothetical protein [Kangiella koreensis]|uniref:Uncharacterized protein n=1 Tax=Kangiella koreensis (strain DSM 16069 / JCM 12317 / KCTC 12182 / SW-125) TaxID=523791 RepID=C7RB71_KANKD|nr:hypothetical protein [Kangiella koreensis]ACV26513.1 hypothetical protein Kkor_1094 [Kangiella koreensis DSM 16069]
MSKQSLIEHQLFSSWQEAKELTIPEKVDQAAESAVMDAFDKRYSKTGPSISKSGYVWFYAMAASFLLAIVSWQSLFQEQLSNDEFSQPTKMLLLAINESKKLEAAFEQLKHEPLSEFVYVEKFQLEKELLLINSKLAEAYHNRDNLHDKLQLWHQKNQTLSQLNALMKNGGNAHATHI